MGTNIYNYVTSFSYSYTGDLLEFLKSIDDKISPSNTNPGNDQRNIIIFVDNKNNNDSNNSSYNYIVEISGNNLSRDNYGNGPLKNYFWPVDNRSDKINDDLEYFGSSDFEHCAKHNLQNKEDIYHDMDANFNLWIRTDKTLNDLRNEGNSEIISLSTLKNNIHNNGNGLRFNTNDKFNLRGNSIKATSYWQI